MTFQSKKSHLPIMTLLLGALLLTACHKTVASAPPPPPVTPAVAPPAPTITLRATPTTIERGNSASLQWEAQNAATVRIEPSVGDVGLSGNRDVSPASSVTYTATATGPGGQASDVARITVNAPPPPPATPPPPNPTRNPTIDELFRTNVQTIYFDYDKSNIRADQMSRIQGNAAFLKQNPNVRFTIEGNCDERGSQEYNLALGDRRANAVKDYLVSQGISESRINVISYGEDRPTCREETESCMQNNRRADFVLNP
jgi:peptidoglycan-associated lipoprotein